MKVKICGITNTKDGIAAAQQGADAIGVVLYEKSKRAVTLQQACDIKAAVFDKTKVVALVVNASAETIYQIIATLQPDYLQFHGDETGVFCEQFDYPYIRAIRMQPELDVQQVIDAYPSAKAFLFDAWRPDQYGGTGHSFDWSRMPTQISTPLVLAGGLNPDNVQQAIAIANPCAVDVSGGVEASPGVKDHQRMLQFICRAKDV